MTSGAEGWTGGRPLLEDAVKLLLASAPSGWTRMNAEFEAGAQPAVVRAGVVCDDGWQTLSVSPGVLNVLAEHQRRAAAAGKQWRRLEIDCYSDGRLSVHTDPVTAGDAGDRSSHPVVRRLLVGVTVGCLAAAAVIVAVGWSWTPPPRVEMLPVAAPTPRQQEAFDLIKRWSDAENRSDTIALRAMACSTQSEMVQRMIYTVEQLGNTEYETYPEGVQEFRDEGSQIRVKVSVRLLPLDDEWRQRIQGDEGRFGLWSTEFTLADEGGRLTVCDFGNAPQ